MSSNDNWEKDWCHIEGINFNYLPPETTNANANETLTKQSQSPGYRDIQPLLTRILTQATTFIDTAAPKFGEPSDWLVKETKRFVGSEAPVVLLEKTVNLQGQSRPEEKWFCRKSRHVNKAKNGTASWWEFVQSFKENHVEAEKEYMPTVIDVNESLEWNTPTMIQVDGAKSSDAGQWIEVTMVAVEMKHQTPKLVKVRFKDPKISVTLKL